MFSNLELRVIATLAYSKQFKFPLSTEEIFYRLVSSQVVVDEGWVGRATAVTITLGAIRNTLLALHAEGVVETNGKLWSLGSSSELFAHRTSATRCTQQKAPSIDHLVALLSKVPWVEALFVTGSVAVQNALQHDDIDVLVVTRQRRLWITRLWVLILAIVTGRRVGAHHQDGMDWCFNLWLETDHLQVPTQKHGLYEAYEVLQAKCVWSKPAVAARWLTENSWVSAFVPHEYRRQMKAIDTPITTTDMQFSLAGILGDVVNWMAYILQMGYRLLRYAERPKTYEAAFFHSQNTKLVLYGQWRRIVNRIYHPELLQKTTIYSKHT